MTTDHNRRVSEQYGIIAALDKDAVVWDPVALITEIQNLTHKRWIYKRADDMSTAQRWVHAEERWRNGLRVLVVTYQSLMNSLPPEGTTSAHHPSIVDLKLLFQWKVHQLAVIGISANNMFGELLLRLGCDVTCPPEELHELVITIIQPGSGRIKLPDLSP